ncbi:hypothetical protein [Leptospira sp. B5-022]|uniref:hypothetical protein n=1 Tax=Leptospira sp. B5-022 TaxID=1242992 RepID=UPI001E3DF8B8|nr:hypothetical protein [Leptospira sp. B5-022]
MKKKNIYSGEILAEFDYLSRQLRFLLKDLQVYFFVSQNIIRIQNVNNLERFNSSKFNFLIQLFKILPHTPITAIGYNLHLTLPESKKNSIKKILEESYKELNVKDNVNHSEFLYRIKKEHDILINYAIDSVSGDRVNFNFEDRFIEKSDNKDKSIRKFVDKIGEFNKYASNHIK